MTREEAINELNLMEMVVRTPKAAEAVKLASIALRAQQTIHVTDLYDEDGGEVYRAQKESRYPKWVSVKERLPEKHGWFLTFGPQRRREIVHFDDEDKVWADEDDYGIEVTHWMPLPEPPEEGAV